MKKIITKVSIFILIVCLSSITGCDLLGSLIGNGGGSSSSNEYNDELPSSTGKWQLMNDNDTYFVFDGSNGKMSMEYVEDGSSKYNGSFRVVYRGLGEKVLSPLTFIFKRTDKEKEDWLNCYAEDFEDSFTQFTIMEEEDDLGFIDGTVYTHIYRISELPYKLGTYILEGNEYKEESNNYNGADNYYFPSGTYSLETDESFTFLMTKPRNYELFQYRNGDIIVEGLINISYDKKTVYLYIENDIYQKVRKDDKDNYDTSVSNYYPPDFYLRGDFSNPNELVINDLYHHTYSPTRIEDSTWVFGTYAKK